MKILAHGIQLSPTDLANHVACRHLTVLNLAVGHGRIAPSEQTAWFPVSMQRRGEAHERAYVEHLQSQHLRVIDLRDAWFDAAGFRATCESIRGGADIVLQAPLSGTRWIGRADGLRRVERPSRLGGWSYEPLDTKLARDTRGSAVLQLCAYAEMLDALQGVRPEWMHVVAPGNPFNAHAYRVDDFFAYYSLVRCRLATFIDDAANARTYPEPIEHCEICRWMPECNRRRRADDHLGFVANIRTIQIAELAAWNITTLGAFGSVALPFAQEPHRSSIESLEKAHGQARVQLRARETNRRIYERLALVAGEGLGR